MLFKCFSTLKHEDQPTGGGMQFEADEVKLAFLLVFNGEL